MHLCVSFVFLPLYSSGPCYCTYTPAWHLVMSLHGRCVTQHPDSLGKITLVLDRGKLSLPEVLDFPFCHLQSVGEFSRGQRGYSGTAVSPQTDLLAAKQPVLVHILRVSLVLAQFPSALPSWALFLLCLHCIWFRLSRSLFHITPSPFPVPPSVLISPSVRGLMWDCKWSSLTSISSYQGSMCVAQYQPATASLTLSQARLKLFTHKHGAQAAIILLFIAHIYYIAWVANNNKCTSWSDTMLRLGQYLFKETGMWNKTRLRMKR